MGSNDYSVHPLAIGRFVDVTADLNSPKTGILGLKRRKDPDPHRWIKAKCAILAGLLPERSTTLGVGAALGAGRTGQQQMLVLARALATKPKYLLLDEMSLGLAAVVFKRLVPTIKQIAGRGVGVLLVEQFTHTGLGVASDAIVVASGQVTYHGDPEALLADEATLREAYLG